jgi:tRNA(Ile)-lysidine synthetase-like protein
LKYAKNNRLKYYEDVSNKDINFSRNRIRRLVIPELLKINPAFYSSISREVDLGQEAADFFQGHLRKVKSRVVVGNKIDISKLNKLHPFIAKEVIRQVLHESTGKKADVYQKNVLAVYDLVDKKGAKETKLGQLTIRKTYKYLIFGETPATTSKSKKLIVGEDLLFNGNRITSRYGVSKPSKNNILLPEEFSGNLRVRTWRKGDKIKAEFGSKKIQDVFVDAKIESTDRLRWPVVTHKGEIVWLPKLIASKYAQKKGRSLILEVK